MKDINVRELSILPAIVYGLWQFVKNGCNPKMQIYCKANGEEVVAHKVFGTCGSYFFVQPSFLPLDPNIKAVGFRLSGDGRMYVETTLVDFEKLARKLEESASRYSGLDIRGRSFFWNGIKFAASTSKMRIKERDDPRTVIHSVGFIGDIVVDPWMALCDLLYEWNCFSEEASQRVEERVGISGVSGGMRMRQVQKMSQTMMFEIAREQTPMLTLTIRQLGRICQSSKVLRMNRHELGEHVRMQMSENPVLRSE